LTLSVIPGAKIGFEKMIFLKSSYNNQEPDLP